MNQLSLESWVNENDQHRSFRQAVHTILHAISSVNDLHQLMVMKGGILIALGYKSTRFTKDIDFSTEKKLGDLDIKEFIGRLDTALTEAVDELPYLVDCQVQKWVKQPPSEDATFPTIQINVGYAQRGNAGAQRRLARRMSPHVVSVDFSLNEPLGDPELLEVEEGRSIRVYSYHDLVAEKLRALLQQEIRNRQRRQDVYDLNLLIGNNNCSNRTSTKQKILASLLEKSAARDLPVSKDSMRNPEIIRRSSQEYRRLEHEVQGQLPQFEDAYDFIRQYYEELPWD